jgi:DNA-directed RNA polymerase specialized sigma24 family protein
MRRDPYWKARLERWQLWVFKAPGGARSAFYIERVDCATVFGTLTPAINDEAVQTDQLVARLPDLLKRTVKSVYLDGLGSSLDGIAGRLKCTSRTLHERLCHADLALEVELERRKAGAKAISPVSSFVVESGSLGRATP